MIQSQAKCLLGFEGHILHFGYMHDQNTIVILPSNHVGFERQWE